MCFPSPRGTASVVALIDDFSVVRACPDADELEWYIPAGIGLPDLRRAQAVIEQFETTPLDLGGKRASQLLRKKRRNRRRVRRTRADSDGRRSNSAGGGSEDGDDDDDDDDGEATRRPSKARTTARAREREAYKSAQFIEDSEEEYGRDIDAFFTREAALRERTALAAVDSALGIGTMRASGTKKRRRPRDASRRSVPAGNDDDDDDGDGSTRQTKRRAVSGQSESGPESDDAAPPRRPPKPRPRYRGSARARATTTTSGERHPEGQTAFLDEDVSSHGVGDQDRNVSDADKKDDEMAGGSGAGANGSGRRKGRVVIISDEEE